MMILLYHNEIGIDLFVVVVVALKFEFVCWGSVQTVVSSIALLCLLIP